MQWVLFGVVAWGVRVIPLSPPPQGAFQCMLSQAEGRSEYVSPMGFPSGAYALGSHSATGPTRLGSHWLCLLGAFRGVDLCTPTGALDDESEGAEMAGRISPREIGHTTWPATN